MLRKVISGGQTGVDRAGLDAALQAGITIGGYCAKGRTAEDGTIPDHYPMIELESPESFYRTEKNVVPHTNLCKVVGMGRSPMQ